MPACIVLSNGDSSTMLFALQYSLTNISLSSFLFDLSNSPSYGVDPCPVEGVLPGGLGYGPGGAATPGGGPGGPGCRFIID